MDGKGSHEALSIPAKLLTTGGFFREEALMVIKVVYLFVSPPGSIGKHQNTGHPDSLD